MSLRQNQNNHQPTDYAIESSENNSREYNFNTCPSKNS